MDDAERLETRFRSTYRALKHRASAVQAEVRRGGSGYGDATAKNLRRMVRTTSIDHWVQIQDAMLARIREMQHQGETGKIEYHRSVRLAFLLGILISTGFRCEELCHIRLGLRPDGSSRQYGPAHRARRVIDLRPIDRKNRKSNSGYLRERVCPVWLEKEYLEVSRPRFIERGFDLTEKKLEKLRAQLGSAAGQDTEANSKRIKTLERKLAHRQHDFLLVLETGLPYGDPEESEDGEQRDGSTLEKGKGNLARLFREGAERIALRLDLPRPSFHGEASMHSIRNVVGHSLLVHRGVEAAAAYLGDSIARTEAYYSALDVDPSEVCDATLDAIFPPRGEGSGGGGRLTDLEDRIQTLEDERADLEREKIRLTAERDTLRSLVTSSD